MGNSNIEWTEQTWNPIVGCSIVSPGCTNCYAMRQAPRTDALSIGCPTAGASAGKLTKSSNAGPVWTGALRLIERRLLDPLKRKTPTIYFVNSMGDLFHEDCPDEWIDRVFAVMALCPQHTFQVLTKRAERMRDYMDFFNTHSRVACRVRSIIPGAPDDMVPFLKWPLPNVWLGVSTERQKEADERIPLLLQTPAAVRFISAEPLLGPIDLHEVIPDPLIYNAVHGMECLLDWVIVGGESGHGARPMHPAWARQLRDQCAATGTAFFFKQWGEWAPSTEEQARGNPRSGWCALREHPRVAKAEELYPESGAAFIEHMGKKAAGRLLDGVEHNGMPVARHAEAAE